MPTLYETLGVAPDATPEQIKHGYRRASSAAHPDREGGSKEAQQAVNDAYAVLSDPERRAQYDRDGTKSERPSLDEVASASLADLFQEGINNPGVVDVVGWARAQVRRRSDECRQQIDLERQRIRSLEKRRGTVRVKKDGAPNIVHALIDARLGATRQVITANERMIELAAVMAKLLDDYEFVGEKPSPPKRSGGVFSAGFLTADESLRDTFYEFKFGDPR